MLTYTSKLYSLTPMGANTSQIESLTSYILRLADAHCVYSGDLIDLIAVVIHKQYISRGIQKSSDPFYHNAFKVNGLSQLASDFACAVENLTSVIKLDRLTFLSFGWLPAKNLFKPSQAWCPSCLEDWRNRDLPIYYPLIWCLSSYLVCCQHQIQLKDRCPNCSERILYLTRRSRVGYCPKCGNWLGSMDKGRFENTSGFNYWSSKQIEMLMTQIKSPSEIIANIKNNVITLLTQKSSSEICRNIAITKTTLHGWKKGLNIPTLPNLLKLCYCFNEVLVDVVTNRVAHQDDSPLLKVYETAKKPQRKRTKLDLVQVSLTLSETVASGEENCPSLEEMARKIDISSKTIRKYFPIEARLISRHYINNRNKNINNVNAGINLTE